jgi:hypothetical protein
MRGDVVLQFPQPIPALRHVRSTLVHGGIATLRAAGLYDAYVGVVPAEVRVEIETSFAGMWIPVETALTHYLACDKLGLSRESAAKLGRGTFERTKGLLLGTAIGLARTAGVTPWSFVPHLQRFWLRGLDGGGIQAIRIGPKEVRLEVVACSILRSHYFRGALRGLVGSLFELVSAKVYVHEDALGAETTIALRVQWV